MRDPSGVKGRFRARLQAADSRKARLRDRLLEDGTRALQPILSVLGLMAEVLDEEHNLHGSITGLAAEIDADDFVRVGVMLHNGAADHRITVSYGPVLGGRNYISVSGLGERYVERLAPEASAPSSQIGRSVGNAIHIEEARGSEIAGLVRDMIEDFFAGEAEAPLCVAPVGARPGHLALVQ